MYRHLAEKSRTTDQNDHENDHENDDHENVFQGWKAPVKVNRVINTDKNSSFHVDENKIRGVVPYCHFVESRNVKTVLFYYFYNNI